MFGWVVKNVFGSASIKRNTTCNRSNSYHELISFYAERSITKVHVSEYKVHVCKHKYLTRFPINYMSNWLVCGCSIKKIQ